MARMVVKHRDLKRYGHRALKVGESFEASDKDAAFFRRAKWADDAPLPKAQARPEPAVSPEAPKPDPVQSAPAEPMTTDSAESLMSRRVGRYSRRDMRAEGEDSGETS